MDFAAQHYPKPPERDAAGKLVPEQQPKTTFLAKILRGFHLSRSAPGEKNVDLGGAAR